MIGKVIFPWGGEKGVCDMPRFSTTPPGIPGTPSSKKGKLPRRYNLSLPYWGGRAHTWVRPYVVGGAPEGVCDTPLQGGGNLK